MDRRLQSGDLEAFVTRALTAVGLPASDAEQVAPHVGDTILHRDLASSRKIEMSDTLQIANLHLLLPLTVAYCLLPLAFRLT